MNVTQRHNEAMDLAQRAVRARRAANETLALDLFERAYNMERQVALSSVTGYRTRLILLRSAAALAIDCGRFQEAKNLLELRKKYMQKDV